VILSTTIHIKDIHNCSHSTWRHVITVTTFTVTDQCHTSCYYPHANNKIALSLTQRLRLLLIMTDGLTNNYNWPQWHSRLFSTTL